MRRFRPILAVAGVLCGFPYVALAESPPPHERAPLTADQVTAVAGHNAFAIDLYHQLRTADPATNLLASPFSIHTAFAMTYAGARNRTAEQIADVLHFNLPDHQLHAALGGLIADLNVPREGYEMAVANRLFGQQGMPFKQPFLEVNLDHYGAPLEPVDFVGDAEGSREYINDWVAEQTRDRIQDLMPAGSIDTLTRLVLTNAVYFNGQWKYQFEPEDTHDAAFHVSATQQIQTPMMFQSAELRYGSFDGFEMLEMPYAGDDLSMVIMLPAEVDGVAELESRFTLDLFQESVTSLEEQEVDVYLPRFSYSDEFSLKTTLQNMGMTDAFIPGVADFDGIADRNVFDLYITGVFHKTFIDVNEEGTEAAAATGIGFGITSLPPPPPEFRADHPFLFALRDVHSGSLLFLGRLVEPEVVASSVSPPPGLEGDLNHDGVVNAADYTVWRDNLDSNPADFNLWRSNFGASLPAGATIHAMPEPNAGWLLIIAVALGYATPAVSRRRGQARRR